MKSSGKYIILICDEPQHIEAAFRLFQESPSHVGVSLAGNAQELTTLLEQGIPQLIIVCLVSGNERNITYLENLRKDIAIDHVPILVYSRLPDRADILRILESLGGENLS